MKNIIKVFKGSNEGFRVKIGAFYFRYFKGLGVRLQISFSRDIWVKLFGFNQRNYGV